ncbi:MAG TPA: winged helix-turn-helix domain-containing protein [Streptosporangiaceae bacterium]
MTLLRCPVQRQVTLGGWRERAYGQLISEPGRPSGQALRHQLRPLTMLMPHCRHWVDLLTLTGETATFEEGTEALLAMPRDRVLAELHDCDRRSRLPSAAWAIADPGGDARRQLTQAVEAAYRGLVEPYWQGVESLLRAEQARRGRILMDRGIDGLLSTLNATRIRWRPPVLDVLGPSGGDVYLDGRGLTLVPSVFIGNFPAVLADTDERRGSPLTLAYPVSGDPAGGIRLWGGAQPAGKALAALLGRTRAAVLDNIADGCTTTELARKVGVSPAAASQHATVLREAGLIMTCRQGSAVWHTLTDLGAQLLDGQAAPDNGARSAGPVTDRAG